MMLKTLTHLIAEARSLANDVPCAAGHDWEYEGSGRACPTGNEKCSQTVFVCVRCGAYDYGEKDGPGMTECQATCGDSMLGWVDRLCEA